MGPSIIAIGLPPDHPSIAEFSSIWTPQVVRMGLDKTAADCKGAGYDYVELLITPEEDFNRLIKELKGRQWDGVLIGFGVRGNPRVTEFFEKVVNAVAEHAPGAKFIFNHSPDSSLEGARRQLPNP
ncbi:hypothetical protein FRB96_001630 [Tulasnella sp. 330]|nr:hypothetical protein FRB96_001630 [Tulasnella sp. 330]KAG8868804.1 hypothetical protein FRB97_001889 [Tulasnella sp. 331]